MTDDLVKRLRMAGDWARKDYPQFKSQHVTEEAADRIEALEAALQLIADACAENEWPDGTQQLARAALGEKKDV